MLKPNDPEAYVGLGNALRQEGRVEEAIAAYSRAILFQPAYPEAYLSLGLAFHAQDELAAAAVAFGRAIALRPDWPEAHLNLGNALRDQGRLGEAIAAFRQAVALDPSFADGHQNLALALLENGEFAEGWREYEWRWRSRHPRPRQFARPLWSGKALGDRVLLLHAEQGFGDTIQFCRYVPLVAERAPIVLEAPRALLRLLSGLPGVARAVAEGDELPPFDAHCPLMSLPRVFGTILATIPAQVPYLAADAAATAAWRERLSGLSGLRVGLVWAANAEGSANPAIARDRRRKSLTLGHFAPLAELAGVSLVSLQKGAAAAETRSPPPGLALHDWTDRLDDFADTVALIEALDLVISVDTAVAHLAGALAKPVWLLNRCIADWRWLRGRDDSPWYPSLRQFRQPAPGDWTSVLDEVRAALAGLAASGPPSPADRAELDPARSHLKGGLVLLARGKLAEAVPAFERAIALRPADPAAYCNLGAALLRLDRLDEAVGAFSRAITLDANLAEAHSNLGVVGAKQGRTADAVAGFRRAVELRPDWVEAHANLAAALKQQGDIDGAAAAFGRAAALRPGDAAAYCNLGLALLAQDKADEAIAAFNRAIALKHDLVEAYANLGVAHSKEGNLEAAVAALRQAVSRRPDLPEAYLNLGNLLQQQGDLAGSVAAYRQAIAIRGGYAMARFGLSLALLLQGEYEEGWLEYEWRNQGGAEGAAPPPYPQPRWEGQDISGKTVLVYAEQGFGDTLQFVRYVPLVARRGARVVVAAAPPLLPLLRRLEGAALVCGPGEPLPALDYHSPVMSLPLVFGTRVESIPAAIPYLRADPGKAAAWRQRLAAIPGLRVGLVWAGSAREDHPAANAIDRRRSITLGHFAALAEVPAVSFVSLQKGGPAAQTRTPPPGLAIHDWTHELADFDDTSALIEALDLVISVDTSVVHLAGAMGKPVWLLNRFDSCWRWLMEREDSPWYPSLRQFRQPGPGDWAGVIRRVGEALRELAARRFPGR